MAQYTRGHRMTASQAMAEAGVGMSADDIPEDMRTEPTRWWLAGETNGERRLYSFVKAAGRDWYGEERESIIVQQWSMGTPNAFRAQDQMSPEEARRFWALLIGLGYAQV